MRANWLSNRVFKSYEDIVDHCCYAWNTLVDQPWKIMSIAAATGLPSVSHREGWYKCGRVRRAQYRQIAR